MARSSLWRMRAQAELQFWPRTWFATLTLHPDVQRWVLEKARDRMAKSGSDFDALDYGEQFRLRVSAITPAITKVLKRIRKNGAPFRYLLVAEAHKSGAPHFHALIHELSADRPIRYDTLKAAWNLGFSQFKLCEDNRHAGYLCKYLSKSAAARVRASKRYGQMTGRPFVIAENFSKRAPLTTQQHIVED